MAIAGQDYCLLASDTRFRTDSAVICINGYHADGLELIKEVMKDIKLYQFRNEQTMTVQSIAQLVMTKLYSHRFFPYYTFVLLGGIDEEGKGAVYSFDPVGSFEREKYRAVGSAASLIQPLLDSHVGQCNRTESTGAMDLDLQNAIQVARDAFNAATERDIYTGDSVQVWVLSKKDCRMETYPLRRD